MIVTDSDRLLHDAPLIARHGVTLSHFALLCAAAIYSGFNVLAARCLGSGVSPVGFSVIREAAAFPLMYCFAAYAERPLRLPSSDWLLFAILGALLGGFQLCFAIGISLTDARTAALFQCLEPSTAAILACLLRQERLTIPKMLAAILAAGGVALITLTPAEHAISAEESSSGPQHRPAGSLFLFLQGVGIACYCLLQKRLVQRTSDDHHMQRRESAQHAATARGSGPARYGPVTVTAHAYLASLVVMLCAAAVDTAAGVESVAPLSAASFLRLSSPLALVAVAYAILLSSCIGYSLRAWANVRLDASTLVLYNAVQPPLTAVLGVLFAIPGEEQYGWREAGGTLLVMSAVFVSAKGESETMQRCVRSPTLPIRRALGRAPMAADAASAERREL